MNDLRNHRRRHLAQHGPPSTYSMVHFMSEFKRYGMSGFGGGLIEIDDGPFFAAEDFDAQRLRADTAEGELKALKHPMNSAQQLRKDLAAAEQRIAEMKKGLEKIKYRLEVFIQDDHAMMPASLEVTLGIADAALNQKTEAESHGRIPD